ncbi:sugar transferase [Devosia sp.]|uniref:sugar transferase n=1 Tax=Devosia sp. TaxID=1871048 RepID=UPI003A8D1AD3
MAELPSTNIRNPPTAALDADGLVSAADTLEISSSRERELRLKRFADILVSAVALVAFAPLLLGVALLIRAESHGPILFRQPREGLKGRVFQIWKFRTMFVDQSDPSGTRQTVPDDGRVTGLGRWLRRTDIDELPQLINVLRGDMSLIGPRPHPLGMLAGGRPYPDLVPRYADRHAMRPGMTGWAQCHGLRGPTDDPDRAVARIDHDLFYVQNFSLLLDLRIVGRTIMQEMRGGTGT